MKKLTALFLICLLLVSFSGIPADAAEIAGSLSSSGPDVNPFSQNDLQRRQRLQNLVQPDSQLATPEQKQAGVDAQAAKVAQQETARLDKEAGRTWLIQFRAESTLTAIADVLQDETWSLIGPSESRLILLTTGDIDAFSEKAAGLTVSIEKNQPMQIDMAVNDTYYAQQWALDAINAPEAWEYTTGNPVGAVNPVYVAVIDSGIDRT
ncbi:MAG: hypothetical protein SCM11_08660, partial [Bacillota bacterium]|nr:hypothetical protein [Bacillota bacterium]